MLYISLRQYEYVVAVVEARSLTAAAARLHVSQPSLSVAITRVEDALGQKIFVRNKGASIVITPFGHRFAERARKLLELAHDIEQRGDERRSFVLGCFEDIAPWYLAPIVDKLESDFPTTSFRGLEGGFSGLARDVAEGRVDIAISYDIGFAGNFEQQKLRQVTPVAFVPFGHPLARLSSVELQQVAEHPVILSSEDLSEGYIQSLFDSLELSLKTAHRTSSLELMRSLAAHGKGVGISYSCPPGNTSYDGRPLITVPISTPCASADLVLFWSNLRDDSEDFGRIRKAIAGFFC